MTANLLDFDLEGLAAFCASLGEKKFRATQLFRWIHQKGASDFAEMTDLAKSLRSRRPDEFAGREVFAIPGSIHNPLARGCHQLIREGAKLVETAMHVLEEIVGGGV